MKEFFLLLLIAIISYPLGCINGAIIWSKLIWRKDIRDFGSKNAGATNFLRTFGAPGTVLVVLTDVLKGLISAFIGKAIMGMVGYAIVGGIFAGFCCILGHCFPVVYGFKGGKGALSSAAVAFAVDWRIGLIAVGIYLVTVILTRYSSLGSLLAAVSFPLVAILFGFQPREVWLCVAVVAIVIFNHRSNIKRLLSGTESRLKFGGTSNSTR